MNKISRLIVASFLYLYANTCFAAQYYISADGNDANTGLSYAQRWATPQKACDTLVAGDIADFYDDGGIFYNSGTAVDTLALCNTNSGISGNLITFQAATGETPIFEPAETVSSWTSIGGNVYESNVFISNNNDDATQLWKDTTILTFVNDTCGASLNVENEYCTCGSGCTSTGRVRIYTTGTPSSFTYRAAASAASGDAHYGFRLRNVQYIKIKGIKVQYSEFGFLIGTSSEIDEINADNNILEDVTSDYAFDIGIAWSNSVANPISSGQCLDCNAYHTGTTLSNQSEHGIKGASSILGVQSGGLIIDGGEFAYNNWHGVQVSEGWDNVIVRNIYSHNNNLNNNNDGSDVRIGNQQLTPVGSHVYSNRTGGTKYGIGVFGQVAGTIIEKNIIDGALTAGFHYDDGVSFPLGENILVKNNIIKNGTGNGALIDANNDEFIFVNNTLDNNSGSAIKILSTVTGGTLKNNVIISPTGTNLLETETGAIFSSNYNAFYSPDSTPFSYAGSSYNFTNYKAASSQDANSINTDFTSQFVNYAGGDYSITYAGAPSLRDAGTTIATVTDDYTGRFRPQNSAYAIGAYEENSVSTGTILENILGRNLVIQ